MPETSDAGLIVLSIFAIVGIFTLVMYSLSSPPPKRKVIMNFHEVNNPAVLRAAALTNTSHRDHEPTEF
jgi:hypothetical protein